MYAISTSIESLNEIGQNLLSDNYIVDDIKMYENYDNEFTDSGIDKYCRISANIPDNLSPIFNILSVDVQKSIMQKVATDIISNNFKKKDEYKINISLNITPTTKLETVVTVNINWKKVSFIIDESGFTFQSVSKENHLKGYYRSIDNYNNKKDIYCLRQRHLNGNIDNVIILFEPGIREKIVNNDLSIEKISLDTFYVDGIW